MWEFKTVFTHSAIMLARLCVAVALLAVASAAAAPPVVVEFYEESGCPDCQDFMQNQLNATLSLPSVAAILDLRVYPWGNAYHAISACPPSGPGYQRADRFCWVNACMPNVTNPPADCFDPSNIICQHGQTECQANDVEMCVTYSYPHAEHQIAVMNFMYCLEITFGLDLTQVPTCALSAGLDMNVLSACATSLLPKLKVHYATETAALGNAKDGVPWVVVNGQAMGDDVSTFLATVCAAYTGPKPADCP